MAPRKLDYGDLIRHDMPSGAVVFYRDEDHSYWSAAKQRRDGKWGGSGRLTGVSTVVAPLDFRPDNLMRWAAHLNGQGVATLAAEGLSLDDADDMRAALSWLTTGDSVWDALAEAKLLWSDYRDARGKQGTNVHEYALHALASGQPVPKRELHTDEEWGYARGVMAFWHVHEPEPLQYEQVVISPERGVAGRFDLRCRIAGETWLIDAKTSGYISNKQHAQVAGYDLLSIESGFGESDRLGILQVDAAGGYSLIDVAADHEDFLAALDTYRRSAAISKRARATREATRQAIAA